MFWHGTHRRNLPAILEEGLQPNSLGIVYLSPDRDVAGSFGEVVLVVEPPGYLRLTAFEDCAWEVLCWGAVPPQCIREEPKP